MTPKLYKAADVCEKAGLQPYVLRSWEKEFPGIGVQKSPDSARFYRQSDVDQVLRIKQLVFGEGLTLAGARRRLETAAPAAAVAESASSEMDEILETLSADARARIAHVRSGLRSILEVLSKAPGANGTPDRSARVSARSKSSAAAARSAPAKRGAVARKAGSAKRKRVTPRF